MVEKQFYNISELSIIFGKTVASIHGHLARKQFDAVPPPIKLGRRLAWPVNEVDAWIADKATRANEKATGQCNSAKQPAKRRGRPRKSERKKGDEQ